MDNARRLEIATRATFGSVLYMTETERFNTIAILTNLTALETNRILMLRGRGYWMKFVGRCILMRGVMC